MPYAGGRVIHDADAHIMEEPGFLVNHLEARYRGRIGDHVLFPRNKGFHDTRTGSHRHAGAAFDDSQIMVAKNWDALGSSAPQDRPRSLDLLGFASQLMFTTALLNYSSVLEGACDPDLTYAVARAHTRHMVDFCSVDRRLLPTGYVPLVDFERTAVAARDAISLGAKALMIPSRCPDDHSPSHVGFDPLWAVAQEAGLPIVFHVGGGGKLLEDAYFNNGLPPVPDFHGGDDNFKSIDYMAIAYPPMKALTALVVDRVLDRFPDLRIDAGWIIANSGDEVCLFSSDYPHVEGGRNPIKRFEASMAASGIGEHQKQRFYRDNFVDLMGAGLAPELRQAA